MAIAVLVREATANLRISRESPKKKRQYNS